jgi:hypothetical protein
MLLSISPNSTLGALRAFLQTQKENTVNLPVVNVFQSPYQVWEKRQATAEEMHAYLRDHGSVNTQAHGRLLETISTPLMAASRMAKVGADNGMEGHIDSALSGSGEYASWGKAMPSKTPPEIARYQKEYPKCSMQKVNEEILIHGQPLCEGQFLFHGGLLFGGAEYVTQRPLSTSLSPQVALRNAEHNGKAYDSGSIDLFVLRVVSPLTKAFVIRSKGTNLGHEKEVLFSAGAKLSLRNRTLIRSDYPAVSWGKPDRNIPIHVVEVDIS